ncbi:MAG: hypothetical protein JNL96_28820 [Planctomycetaceae bacterium]|nr:hypothetical protein [Planctomycetaceae bacterium]
MNEHGKRRLQERKRQQSVLSERLREIERLREAGVVSTTTPKPLKQLGLSWASELAEQAAKRPAGGECSNTPPAISPVGTKAQPSGPEGEFAGGEDMLEISLWIEWGDWEALRSQLIAAKETAKAQADGAETDRGDVLVMFNEEFLMMPTGTNSDGKGPRFTWRMKKDGRTYCIANQKPGSPYPTMKVVVGSLPLMLRGAEQIWELVKADVADLGGTIIKDKLSRVDVCIDLPNVNIEDFCAKFRAHQFVCRAIGREEYVETSLHGAGQKSTGFTIGAGGASLSLNVYDKLHEVCKKQDEAKLQTLIETRWGGALPDCATRIEWRLRREKIAAFEVDTMADWFAKRVNVMLYLTTDWVRFTQGDVDRKNFHQTKAQVWDLWQRVVKSPVCFFGACALRASSLVKKVCFDFKALGRQTLGTLSSAITYGKGVIKDKGEFLAEAFDQLCELVDGYEWAEYLKRLTRKRSVFEASNPATNFGPPMMHETSRGTFEHFMAGGRRLCGSS